MALFFTKIQGWEFAFWFSVRIALLCERKSEIGIRSKTWWKQHIFWPNRSYFESKSVYPSKKNERITHSHVTRYWRAICSDHSFVKSDETDSLNVALFERATRANRSWSLFKESNFEPKSKGRKSERVNSQPLKNRITFLLYVLYCIILYYMYLSRRKARGASQ